MRTAKKSGYLFAVLLLAVSACAGGEEAGAGDRSALRGGYHARPAM
jgi:hypothetical protein